MIVGATHPYPQKVTCSYEVGGEKDVHEGGHCQSVRHANCSCTVHSL